MANEEEKEDKKKKGRPKKKEKKPINEEKTSLVMVENNENEDKAVTINEIQNLWNNIFCKYSDNGIDSIKQNLSNLITNNPFIQNQRVKSINSLPRDLKKEDVEKAYQNPQDNEKPFRELGWHISTTTYIYYKMLRLAMDIPLFNSYVYPKYVDRKTIDSESFKQESKLAHRLLEALNIKVAFKKISMEVKREGKCSYVYRQSLSKEGKDTKFDFALLQKLPSDYIKYTALGSDTSFITSFDFMLFMQPGYSLDQYPAFFTDYYNEMVETGAINTNNKGKVTVDIGKISNIEGTLEYKNGRYLFWRQLPQDQVFCFGSDLSNVWQLPDTIGLFMNLTELSDYKWLQGALTSSPLTNIMTAEVPLKNDPKVPGYNDTSLSPDVILGYQDLYNSMVSGNSAGFFAPFEKFELHSLPNIPNSMDIYSSALQDTITAAGVSGLLTTESKPSVAMVKTSQLLGEAEANFVTKQLESFINVVLEKHLGLKNVWKCCVWGNIFTIENEISKMKDLLSMGVSSAFPRLLSAYGLDVESDNTINDWLDSMGTYDKFHITQSAFQQSKDTKSEKGRPKVDENNIQSDATDASIDSGTNTNDMRKGVEG